MTEITRDELAEWRRVCEAATNVDWAWDGRVVDSDGYVYIPQGSTLGHTLISLGDDYEGSAKDCDYVSVACTALPRLLDAYESVLAERDAALAECERLRKEIDGHESFWRSVNEALNSGDGSYRP